MKKTHRLITICLALLLVLSFTACGSAGYAGVNGGSSYPGEINGAMGDAYYENKEGSSVGSSDISLPENRIIIKTVDETVETLEYDAFLAALDRAVSEADGYFSSSSYHDGGVQSTALRRATFVIRVPADKLSAFCDTVDGIGHVTSFYEQVDDITLAYVAIESRIEVLVSEEIALLSMLGKAENITDMLAIRNQLEKYQSYVPLMELKAPEDGIVIYVDPDRRWGNDEIKIGMDVSKGHILLTIPEMSNLMVDFDLPESYRSKTKAGDRVIISPDSLPGVKFEGVISRIATLPVNQIFWDDSSPKIYRSRITLDQQDPRLVNGMTVQLDVVSEVLKNVLFIPVEAVFEDDSRFFVYRNVDGSPEEVDVKIGRSNDNFVEITDGLKDGDIVYLYRPYQKKQTEE